MNCAKKGLKSITKKWPDCNIRMFVFGSTAKNDAQIGAMSDLDIAISGLRHIAEKSYECESLIEEAFRSGLPDADQTLPIDVVIFDANHPETTLQMEIAKNGIEIRLE